MNSNLGGQSRDVTTARVTWHTRCWKLQDSMLVCSNSMLKTKCYELYAFVWCCHYKGWSRGGSYPQAPTGRANNIDGDRVERKQERSRSRSSAPSQYAVHILPYLTAAIATLQKTPFVIKRLFRITCISQSRAVCGSHLPWPGAVAII